MKKIFIIIVLFTLMGCKTNNQTLTKDDYDILELVIQHNLSSYAYDLDDDIALNGLQKGSNEYKKKINELYNNESYESDYYYYIDDILFVFKNNFYIEKLYKKNDFDGNTEHMIPLKIDFSKIKTKKHLIRVDKNSPFRKSKNCVELKFSRIIYDGDKAAVVIINNSDRVIGFYKKSDGNWSVYGGGSIPFEFDGQKIDL